MDDLDASQRLALAQFKDIMSGVGDDVAVSVLDSAGWDVQRAAGLMFDPVSPSARPLSSSSSNGMQTFDLDDSQQNRGDERHQRYRPTLSSLYIITRPIMSLLALPLHVFSSIFRFVFGILRIPIPQLRFTGLNLYRPLRPRASSRSRGPDMWVRELEEETGAVCISRSKAQHVISSSGADPGPSSLIARTSHAQSIDDGRKLLPDFTLGSYEEVLRICRREARIGCIILVSEEHDDVTDFKRSTLTDPAFVKLLHDNNVVVWGGDVRDREPWSAAEKLQATTYPFVAFVALQPRRNPVSSTSSSRTTSPPTLTVLSRHQGRCVPSTAPTSAYTLVEHLQKQVLPRVGPFLERIQVSQRERERDRQLREEQDRAFRDSALRDKERIEAKIAAERAELEAKRREEEEAKAEVQRKTREAEETRKREVLRMDWRRWSRRAIVPDIRDPRGGLRVAIRLPNGERVIQQFKSTATLTALYTFVDTRFIPLHFSPQDDPPNPPEGVATGEAAIEERFALGTNPAEWWGFNLVLAYPRKEIPWKARIKLSELESLKGGGQIVVETLGAGQRRLADDESPKDDDDGYSTEDSDE